jgi:hypothetical protein
MNDELEHLLMTHSDYEGISEQGCLQEMLTALRNLAEQLQLRFDEALSESDAAYRDRLMQSFDPGL